MIVREINEGPKIDYTLDGTVLTLGGGAVSVDLATRQQDTETVIDICRDDGHLVEGMGRWYVATIIIPPRRYHLVDTGQVDENGAPVLASEALPLDLDAVVLNLWALPETSEGGSEV
ncbi:AAA family ATPase [Thermoanaerobacterium sp. DL9XJH110]|uniref:AAA family ATPase n=1 Tax=Thermoanaerobacterium sp. DL9XJH110 TaxID=3386643 RepID=UPI003BB6382E